MDLLAYIPQDRRTALARAQTVPDRISGTALFADVSGFTPLTHTFAKELGSRRGAEALLGVLNPLFEALIEPVHRYGGSVIGFVGDAITCWFDDQNLMGSPNPPPSDLRAVAAALAMQAGIAQFTTIYTPAGTEISLSIKAAIASGPARRFLVGDPTIQRIDVLAGETLVRMAVAEKHARAGEIIVSREVAVSLADVLHLSGWYDEEQYAVADGLATAVETSPWPLLSPESLPGALSRQWLLPTIYEQLHSGTGSLGDLRPVTPLMLRFSGIDFDTDDEAGTKLDAFVSWVQRIVHHHGGVLLQLTIGDKGAFLYAPFGAPQAHENDPQRAMQAALALRELPPNLASFITPLQMGLTRGEVWTGNCGGHGRFTYGVIGSEVNLAARLMSRAKPGQILISGRMSQYPGFRLQFLGDSTYKGFDQLVPTYSLLGEWLAEDRVFSMPMVGRAAELQQLVDFAQPLATGKLAGTALIYGESGIGKSRLAFALRQHLTKTTNTQDIAWFAGQTDQILRQAFNPFVYWLKGYFEQADDTVEQNKTNFEYRLEQLRTALNSLPNDEQGTTDGSPPQSLNPKALIAELIRTQSFLGALLGLHWDNSLYQQLDDPKLRHQNMLTAIKTLLLVESTLHPVVFELEDGHWLDESSREMLLTLSRNVTAYPLLIVITSRYYDDGSKPVFALDGEMPTLTLDLNTLSREALEQQAVVILSGPVAPELLTLLWERSHANPFFVEQILLHFRETGALVQRPTGDWGLETTPTDLPADVNTMLIARIDRLTQEVKQVVQVAAVLGREFDVHLLANMLRADVLPAVQQAENEQIWSLLYELRYIFKHTLLRDAAYEMQLRTRLRELHFLAATATEQMYADQLPNYYDTLAYHYRLAHQLGAVDTLEKTCDYLRKAGETAQSNYANEAALEYYSRLLPLLANKYEQAHLHMKRGQILYWIGKWSEAENEYRDALNAAQDDANLKASAQYEIGKLCDSLGDYETALDWLALAQTGYKQLRDDANLAKVFLMMGNVWDNKGGYIQAHDLINEGLKLMRALADKPGMVQALNDLGWVEFSKGDHAMARELLEESLCLGREIGNKAGVQIALSYLGNLATVQGNYIVACALQEESLAIIREIGMKQGIKATLQNLSEVAKSQGDYDRARTLLEEGLRLAQELADKAGMATSFNDLGYIAFAQGDYAAAQALCEESLMLRREIGNKRGIVRSLHHLGIVTFAQGDYAKTRVFFEETRLLSEEIEHIPTRAHALLNLGLVGLAEGAPQSRQYILDSLRLRREMGVKRDQTSSLIGVAGLVLQEGNPQFAAQLLGAVAAALKALNAPMAPEMKSFHAQTVAKVKEALGEEAFNSTWGEGSCWSLEKAVMFALRGEEEYADFGHQMAISQ